MIPAHWTELRDALRAVRHEQSREGYEWAEHEEAVTDEDFAVLDEIPVEPGELAEFTDMRGEYRHGDTQGFVIDHEERCARYNCWMIRGTDGKPQFISEPPHIFATRIPPKKKRRTRT